MKCPNCKQTIRADSKFCRHCGAKIDGPAPVAKLRDMADLVKQPLQSVILIDEYLQANPESPHRLALQLTHEAGKIMLAYGLIEQSAFTPVFNSRWSLAESAARGLPDVLATGVVTTARIVLDEDEDRVGLIENIRVLADGCAKPVRDVFKEARREAESFLIGGEERVTVERISAEQMTSNAQAAQKAVDAGDLSTAAQLFTKLKALEPSHPYHRKQLGWIHFREERYWDALREWLYGFYLSPMDEYLANNTMSCLTGFGLYPPAVEVARHHRKIVPDTDSTELLAYEALARVCFSALIGVSAEAGPDKISKEAPDFLDMFVPERPWLQEFIQLDALRVFISYRRAGAADMAARLEQVFESRWKGAKVFLDASDLIGGENWLERLRDEIAQADIVMVLIDKKWASDERLADRNDVTRREVAWALLKPADVIPILVGGASMPSSKTLPSEIQGLTRLQGMALRKAHFDEDAQAIFNTSMEILKTRKLRDREDTRALDELEELMQRDEVMGDKKMQEMFGPAIASVPKFVPEKATAGRGVPIDKVELHGTWSIQVTLAQGRMELRFTIEHHETPFRGHWLEWNALGQLVQDVAIEGTWLPIYDVESNKMLGFHLDGARHGRDRFTIKIPFDRFAGESIVSADPQGSQYVCRNVEPRSGGF